LKVTFDGKNARIIVGAKYRGKTCGVCGDNNDESEEEFSGPDLCLYSSAKDFFESYAVSGQHCEQTKSGQQLEGMKWCPQKNELATSSEEDKTAIKTQKEIKQFGDKTIIRQSQRLDVGNDARAQHVQTQANLEELARVQQKQVEEQMARQDGQPLSPGQKAALVASTPAQQKMIQRMRNQYMERDDMICFSTKPVLTCVSGIPVQTRDVTLDFHCLPKASEFTRQLMVESETQVLVQLAKKRVDLRQIFPVPVSCQ
jgi:hypothetical protein